MSKVRTYYTGKYISYKMANFMKTDYQTALEYVDKGLLSMREDNEGHQIFCYTKGCFFGGNWDVVTKTHRGMIYKNQKQVNRPFDKIFNVGEVPETEQSLIEHRLQNEDYEVYDKANGHLFIMSCYKEEGEWNIVLSTKGSLPHEENELLNYDVEVFDRKFRENVVNWLDSFKGGSISYVTMMFESINSFDKHTMYDQQVQMYGDETFVVLSMMYSDDSNVWYEATHDLATIISGYLGFPIVSKYSNEMVVDLDDMKNHKDIEGYVIRFYKDDYRVKVKTKEYWAARFKKDLTAEKTLKLFASGGYTKMQDKLPEEVLEHLYTLLKNRYVRWFTEVKIDTTSIRPYMASAVSAKQVFTEFDELSHSQKAYIVDVLNEQDPLRKIESSRAMREEYEEYAISSEEFEKIKYEIDQIVDSI